MGSLRMLRVFDCNMEYRVIPDVLDDISRSQGSYPEGFMSFSIILAEICMCVTLVKKT